MKFHALALCLAGTLAACVGARADDSVPQRQPPAADQSSANPSNASGSGNSDNYNPNPQRGPSDQTDSNGSMPNHANMHAQNRRGRQHEMAAGGYDVDARDPYTGFSLYAGAPLYGRVIMDPNLPSEQYVARKVTQICRAQDQEIADLRAIAPKAVTAGYDNVQTVYQYMAGDHERLANFADRWLAMRDFPVPTPPAASAVADIAPDQTVDRMIEEHIQMMNDALAARRGEPSITVRTLLLWEATTANCHISLLRMLDSDLSRGRKTVSARLRLEMPPYGTLAANDETTLLAQEVTEEREYWIVRFPPQIAVVPAPRPQVAQAPAPQPAPPAPTPTVVAETPAPAPAPAPVAVTRTTTTRSRVAGSRQHTTTRKRRPAY